MCVCFFISVSRLHFNQDKCSTALIQNILGSVTRHPTLLEASTANYNGTYLPLPWDPILLLYFTMMIISLEVAWSFGRASSGWETGMIAQFHIGYLLRKCDQIWEILFSFHLSASISQTPSLWMQTSVENFVMNREGPVSLFFFLFLFFLLQIIVES
jgi:hypothetical protein